jgi:hypothetical protein
MMRLLKNKYFRRFAPIALTVVLIGSMLFYWQANQIKVEAKADYISLSVENNAHQEQLNPSSSSLDIRFEPSGTHYDSKGNLKIRLDFYPSPESKTYSQCYIQVPDFPNPDNHLEGYNGDLDKDGKPVDTSDYIKWVDSLPKIWHLNPCLSSFIIVPPEITKTGLDSWVKQYLNADVTATIDDIMTQPNSSHLISPYMKYKSSVLTKDEVQSKAIVNLSKTETQKIDNIATVNSTLADFNIKGESGGIVQIINPQSIDAGSSVTTRVYVWDVYTDTGLLLNNPVNADGVLDTCQYYINWHDCENVRVGTFSGSGASWTPRDYEDLGGVSVGALGTSTGLNITAYANDVIGIKAYTGTICNIWIDTTGGAGNGVALYTGDGFSGTQSYTVNSAWDMSLYATGTEGFYDKWIPSSNSNGTPEGWQNPGNAYIRNGSAANATAIIPTVRAVGSMAHGTTGAVTPGWPSGYTANDIILLFATTIAGGSVSITTNGSIGTWNAVSGSPVDVTSGEKLYVWWGRYSSGSTAPSVTPGGDHCVARMIAILNCPTSGEVIDVVANSNETTSDTSFSFATGLTTNYNNELVVVACTTGYDPASDSTAQFGTWTGANLGTKTERIDNDVNEGGGGGLGVMTAPLVTAGAVGTVGATLANASPKAYITFALKNKNPTCVFSQIYDGFGITDPSPTTTITQVEIGYSCWATATQKLNLYTSADGGSNWSSAHLTANLATSNPGDYTYIDVTADQTWTWTLLNNTNFKVRVDTQLINGTPVWSLDAVNIRVHYEVYTANISLDVTTKAFGTVATSTTYYAKGSAPSNPVQDSECTYTLTNSGSDSDIDVHGHNFTGGVGWTLTSSAPGSNEVRITVYASGTNPASGIVLTTSDQEFISNLGASATKKFDFKMETGSSFGDGSEKTGIITFTARAVS